MTASHGSGSSITSPEMTITWGGTAPTAPNRYASLRAAPGSSPYCKSFPFGLGGERVKQAEEIVSFNGHVARVEIWATRQNVNLNEFCIESRFVSESTPGALLISWNGVLHVNERTLQGFDGNFVSLNFTKFLDYYSDTPPSGNETPEGEISLACEACHGGTLQTRHITIELKHLKRPVLYAYGEHSFVTQNSATVLHSKAEWTTPAKLASDACRTDSDGVFYPIACGRARAAEMLDEVKEDLSLPIPDEVLDIIIGWLS